MELQRRTVFLVQTRRRSGQRHAYLAAGFDLAAQVHDLAEGGQNRQAHLRSRGQVLDPGSLRKIGKIAGLAQWER
ncbi:MAG: hypothetical protein JO352_09020 [Chloroflexi bacterium]|nr:hypothetical protein [Chloroflexota bacterium]MBV9601674.1 hypothetical protein [Chloroflexota bacterium]